MTSGSDSTGRPPDFELAAIQAIADPFQRLCVIMKRLLDPGGCPWDREQTHQSLRQYTLEEAHEVAEAIDEGDDRELCEELGDLGLQVVFHAELAQRRGTFRLDDVYTAICDKLIRRHPHVFGDLSAETSDAVLKNWEVLKKEEKRSKAEAAGKEADKISALSGVPKALPGLQRATRLQEKAARVGFDWDRPEDVAAKVREEVEEFLEHVGADSAHGATGALDEAAMTEEFGDLLFALVNLSRFLNIRAEEAIERACNKFIRRFTAIERMAETQGRHLKDMTLEEMDQLWEDVKSSEKREGTMKIKVVVHEAEEGGYWAEVPSIPGCATQGATFEELLANLYEAVEGCLAVDIQPPPTDDNPRILEIAI